MHIKTCIYIDFESLMNIIGNFRLLKRLDFPEMKFSLYFLGYEV